MFGRVVTTLSGWEGQVVGAECVMALGCRLIPKGLVCKNVLRRTAIRFAASHYAEGRSQIMTYSIIKALAASGLLLFGSIATAQYQLRVPYYAQAQDERVVLHHDQVFDRVRGDLARAQSGTLPLPQTGTAWSGHRTK
jgi:hypothetical protein